jgi:hypothetical protein
MIPVTPSDNALDPFRRVKPTLYRFAPAVGSLARTIYEEWDLDRMPELADALEQAGCPNTYLLQHCRAAGPHVRGCWVLDLLLGKE